MKCAFLSSVRRSLDGATRPRPRPSTAPGVKNITPSVLPSISSLTERGGGGPTCHLYPQNYACTLQTQKSNYNFHLLHHSLWAPNKDFTFARLHKCFFGHRKLSRWSCCFTVKIDHNQHNSKSSTHNPVYVYVPRTQLTSWNAMGAYVLCVNRLCTGRHLETCLTANKNTQVKLQISHK